MCFYSYREALRKKIPCYKERFEFSRTRMSEINKTTRNTKCITQDENNDLGSVFDAENFIGLECPVVNVRFSDVNIPRVRSLNYVLIHFIILLLRKNNLTILHFLLKHFKL